MNSGLKSDNEQRHVNDEEHEGSRGGYVNKNKQGTEQFFTSRNMELDSDAEVSIVIPNEIAAQIKQEWLLGCQGERVYQLLEKGLRPVF